MSLTQQAAPPPVEERVRRVSPIRKLLVRPEMGSIAGAIAVWIFFAIVAGNNGFLSLRGTSSYLSVSADIGIVAVAVALLMIGGEFDLSIGSITGAAGMILQANVDDVFGTAALALGRRPDRLFVPARGWWRQEASRPEPLAQDDV